MPETLITVTKQIEIGSVVESTGLAEHHPLVSAMILIGESMLNDEPRGNYAFEYEGARHTIDVDFDTGEPRLSDATLDQLKRAMRDLRDRERKTSIADYSEPDLG